MPELHKLVDNAPWRSDSKSGVLAAEGVHYSDLFEQYLPVQDKPRHLLADWLPEYFFKTPEGTWRPPANDEERAQKEALRTSGMLRRIKRFARALLEGVPPHDRDCPANVATAADWIRQCRRAGLYDFGRVLYEKGGFSFEELGDEVQLEVETDRQIARVVALARVYGATRLILFGSAT